MPKHNPLIIALDTQSSIRALHLVRKLKVTGCAFKVGLELFSSFGPKIVEKIMGHHVRVFLDLKFHDIPNTVSKASEVATKLGVWMFNVHASGGLEMMMKAKEASLKIASKEKLKPPLLTAVTVLTSMNDISEINIPHAIENQVLALAKLSQKAGLDGVVCSGQEASLLKSRCGEKFCLVTPGVRLSGSQTHDQKRVLSPKQAMESGSHYLVIGRSITESKKPLIAVEEILSSLN